MNNKMNNMLNEFFANTDAKNEEELNQQLQEFIKKYNNGEIEYKMTPLDEAYGILEKAENAKSKKQAIKLAKQAYEKSAACFDAILFQADLEDDTLKRDALLNDGLKKEQARLQKEGYFEKDNLGHFYQIFETRPYIRGLCIKAHNFAENGQLTQAKELCKEILKLNPNDNMGARYILMAVYACLELEKDALTLYKKYPEENLEMLYPLFSLYYKLGNNKKAEEYLKKINKVNPSFIKLYQGKLDLDEIMPSDYYSIGDESEVFMYVHEYLFLLINTPNINDYILHIMSRK